MKNRRAQDSDRRHDRVMPHAPFKDSNGATIKECRRRIPDRRHSHIKAEWIDEVILH